MTRGLRQATVSGISWKWRGAGVALFFPLPACLCSNGGRAKFDEPRGPALRKRMHRQSLRVVAFSRYCFGVRPVHRLNARWKVVASAKPIA
jgi:hypothetical protein